MANPLEFLRPLSLRWTRLIDGTWCPFYDVDLSNVNTIGVYMIWYNGTNEKPGRVVRVGQGNIADRLRCHRIDPEISKYSHHNLFVTWAEVPSSSYLDGIEKYLFDAWEPLVGERSPFALPIAVNSPWLR